MLFRSWLQALTRSKILTHGRNYKEKSIIQRTKHIQINTEDLLKQAIEDNHVYAREIDGTGIRYFERYVKFQRKGCEFLKHKINDITFFNEAYCSAILFQQKQPQRVCPICNAPQDIFLYCLEDAFSCLLIEVVLGPKFQKTDNLSLEKLIKNGRITYNS